MVDGRTPLIEYVDVDPVERWAVSGCPYDVRHLHDPPVLHDRLAVTDSNRPREAHHSGGVQILGLDSRKREGPVEQSRSQPPSDGVGHR